MYYYSFVRKQNNMKSFASLFLICALIGTTLAAHRKSNSLGSERKNKQHESKTEDRAIKDFTKLGGKCYYYSVDITRDYDGATEYCQSNQMRLASLSSKEDNDDIKSYFANIAWKGSVWTSGRRIDCDPSIFVWKSSNEPVIYTNWAQGEPNNLNGNESCIELVKQNTYINWNDNNCANVQRFICEAEC